MSSLDVMGSILDLGGSLCNAAIGFGCVYLAQVILSEREVPAIQHQRVSLYLVALASFFNAFTTWPEWALIGGHRPTAIFVYLTVAANIWVMNWRGNMVNGSRMQRHEPGHPVES